MAVIEDAVRVGHHSSGLAQSAVCLAVAAAGADFTGLALFDRAGGATMVAACRHRTEAWAQAKLAPGEGLAGRVLRTGVPAQVSDYQSEARTWPRLTEVIAGERAAGLTAVPVRGRHRIVGVLYAGLRRPGTLGPGLDGLCQLAELVGAALDNAAPDDGAPAQSEPPPPGPGQSRPTISTRERDILRGYADGLSTREIAAAEFLAVIRCAATPRAHWASSEPATASRPWPWPGASG